MLTIGSFPNTPKISHISALLDDEKSKSTLIAVFLSALHIHTEITAEKIQQDVALIRLKKPLAKLVKKQLLRKDGDTYRIIQDRNEMFWISNGQKGISEMQDYKLLKNITADIRRRSLAAEKTAEQTKQNLERKKEDTFKTLDEKFKSITKNGDEQETQTKTKNLKRKLETLEDHVDDVVRFYNKVDNLSTNVETINRNDLHDYKKRKMEENNIKMTDIIMSAIEEVEKCTGYTKTRILVGCPLCIEGVTEPVALLCGHIMCKTCADQMVVEKEGNRDRTKCPVCRTVSKSTIKLYT